MRPHTDLVKGTARIAAYMDMSVRTLHRKASKGQIPGLRKSGTGGRTSMLVIERKALEAAKNGG